MLTFTERGDGDHICGPVTACVVPFIDRQGIAQQCLDRLPRSIPWCFQELLVGEITKNTDEDGRSKTRAIDPKVSAHCQLPQTATRIVRKINNENAELQRIRSIANAY